MKKLLSLFILILSFNLYAQEGHIYSECDQSCETTHPMAFSIIGDNDALSSGEDRNYTGGLTLALSGDNSHNFLSNINAPLRFLNSIFNLEKNIQGKHSLLLSSEIGFIAFTPRDIASSQLISNDRPYASLLYLSTGQRFYNKPKKTLITTSLLVGLLGTDLIPSLQNTIHKAIGSDEARGWDNQISTGVEPTFSYYIKKTHNISIPFSWLKLNYSYGAQIGYITHALYELDLKIGKLKDQWWNYEGNTGRIGAKAAPQNTRDFYFQIGGNIKARAYNAFLQGQFKESLRELSFSDTRPIVYEFWVGVSKQITQSLRLSYFYRHHSSEIRHGLGDTSYSWGGLQANITF